MQRLVRFALSSNLARLLVAAVIVALPMGIAVSWIGAAYQTVLAGSSFTHGLLRIIFPALPTGVIAGLVLTYPLERWVIGDKDNNNVSRWFAVRLTAYLIFGLIIGRTLQAVDELVGYSYPPAIQTAYYVISISAALLMATVYTLFEGVAQEVARREDQLKGEIKQLRIEIDQFQRSAEVKKVVDTDEFRAIQAQAQALRSADNN
jgi:hypothetical protein